MESINLNSIKEELFILFGTHSLYDSIMNNDYSSSKDLFKYVEKLNNFYEQEKIQKLFTYKYGKLNFNIINTKLNVNMIDNYVKTLKNDGTLVINNYFTKNQCKNILDYIKKFDYISNNNIKYCENKTNSGTYWCNENETINNNNLMELILDEGILHILQEYLNSVPKLGTIMNWKTLPTKNIDESIKDAQLFHQDFTWNKFIKIFVYLNDVDLLNGPHRFVKNSFKNIPKKISDNYFPGMRLSDNDIKKIYGEDSIYTITGEAGTIIIEDTRNMHSGTWCHEGVREIFQLNYTTSFWGAPNAKSCQKGIEIIKNKKTEFYNKYKEIYN